MTWGRLFGVGWRTIKMLEKMGGFSKYSEPFRGAVYDPYDKLDHLNVDLLENSNARPHFQKFGLCFMTMPDGLIYLQMDNGDEIPDDILAEFNVSLWNDPLIRPLFEKYDMWVVE